MHVEEGHDEIGPVRGGELVGGGDVAEGGGDVGVCEGDGLGAPCGPAGVEEEAEVLRGGQLGELGGAAKGGEGEAGGDWGQGDQWPLGACMAWEEASALGDQLTDWGSMDGTRKKRGWHKKGRGH